MDTNGGKIQSFIIKILDGEGFYSKIFSTKSSFERDKKFGRIFGFILIEATNIKTHDFIDYIINEIKEHYSECQRKAIDANGSFDLEKSFEAILQKTNISIARYLQEVKIFLDLKKIHILIGVIQDRLVHFTILGGANSYLIHRRQKNEYSIMNIYDEPYAHENELNPLKLFTQTLTGRVERLDYLVFLTSNVLDYLSVEKIKNTINQNNPQNIQKQFIFMLSQIRLPKHFLFSIIMPATLQTYKKSNEHFLPIDVSRAQERDSMKKLDHAEQTTQKLLHPTLAMNIAKLSKTIKKKSIGLFPLIQRFMGQKNQKKHEKIEVQKNHEAIFATTKNLIVKIKCIFHAMAKNRIVEKASSQTLRVMRFCLRVIILFVKKFFSLPLKTKLIIIAIAIISFILIDNIIIKTMINRQKESYNTYQTIIEEVQKMKQQADEILIYKNEETARLKLIEAKNTLAKVGDQFKNDMKYKTLKTAIEEKLAGLQHSQSIYEPIQIGNWKNLDQGASLSSLLVYYNSAVYSQNTNNKFIYKLNAETHIPSSVYSPLKNVGDFQIGSALGNEIFFINDRQTLYAYNMLNDSLKPVPISLKFGSFIQSMKTFNNKLYLLDTANNQILKFTKRLNGFVNPEEWIRDPLVDIKDALDMAIDGDIYVLKKTGIIIKISLGKLQEFYVKTIDPPLNNPKKIQTKDTMKNIYILDSGNNRIVVIDKEGFIAQQYSSPLFNDLKDFAVLEKDKKIYVLNGTIVYGIAMK